MTGSMSKAYDSLTKEIDQVQSILAEKKVKLESENSSKLEDNKKYAKLSNRVLRER